MALTCDVTLNAVVPGSLAGFDLNTTQAALVYYLWLQKNPANVGQTIPASTLLQQAACLDCGVSEDQLQGIEVWIQRQAAIDAGANVGAFDPAALRVAMQCLTCLPFHRLRAIEVMLRCQVS